MLDSMGLRDGMCGEDRRSKGLFSYVRLETRIPADHPLRQIRELIDAALQPLSRAFDRLYARDGRPLIPPERLLRALLLQSFYTACQATPQSRYPLREYSRRPRCCGEASCEKSKNNPKQSSRFLYRPLQCGPIFVRRLNLALCGGGNLRRCCTGCRLEAIVVLSESVARRPNQLIYSRSRKISGK